MPYVWGYARVSDELQLGNKAILKGQLVDNTSMDTQEYAIRGWWQQNQHLFPDHQFYHAADFDGIFRDPAQSASKIPLGRRPQGALMLSFMQRGDIIVVTDARRLFRDPLDYYQTKAILKPLGVRFIYLNQPNINWDTPEGELMSGMFVILGQHESALHRARKKIAYHSRVERGIFTGSFIPPGYKVSVSIDRDTGKVLKYFTPSKRERWLLRIFRQMKKLYPKLWTQRAFNAWCREHDIRRGPKGKNRWFSWEEFNTSDIIVEHGFPLEPLSTPRLGYRHEKVAALGGHVRRSPARGSRKSQKPVLKVPLETLWNAPAGTSVLQLRRQLCREQAKRQAEAASQEPCSSPDHANSALAASGTT